MANRIKPYGTLTHEEYRERYVPKFPEGKSWATMTEQEKNDFSAKAIELGYKKKYDESRVWLNAWDSTPEWEDLTNEQREQCRVEMDNGARALHEFGKALADGTFDKP